MARNVKDTILKIMLSQVLKGKGTATIMIKRKILVTIVAESTSRGTAGTGVTLDAMEVAADGVNEITKRRLSRIAEVKGL